MLFSYTILYVADVEATLNFYEKALGFQRKFMTPEKDYGELVSGETTLAFASHELGESNFGADYKPTETGHRSFIGELAFATTELDQDWQRAVDAGASVQVPIAQKPWGQRVGYLRDNNGFLIEMCTPMEASDE